MIAAGETRGDRFATRFTKRKRKTTQDVYDGKILHYPILLGTCYLLNMRLVLPAIANYALVLEIALTFAVYEIVRRIPVIRFLVLGMRKERGKA